MELARMAATTRGTVVDFLVRPDEAVTLGRSSRCTVTVRDPKVSRRHCQLSYAQGRIVAVDLASSHGLLHRGLRQPMVALDVGDGFHLGETFIRFVAVDQVDDAVAAAIFAPGGAHERRQPEAAAEDDDGDDLDGGRADDAAAPAAAAAVAVATASPPTFADEALRPGAGSPSGFLPPRPAPQPLPLGDAPAAGAGGWAAMAPSPGAGDVLRLPPSARRAGGPAAPAAPSAAKSLAARLAAEAILSAMHVGLCLVVLLLLKQAIGFDLYAAFGLGD
jgi:predicted component of type VI protein secretion system